MSQGEKLLIQTLLTFLLLVDQPTSPLLEGPHIKGSSQSPLAPFKIPFSEPWQFYTFNDPLLFLIANQGTRNDQQHHLALIPAINARAASACCFDMSRVTGESFWRGVGDLRGLDEPL